MKALPINLYKLDMKSKTMQHIYRIVSKTPFMPSTGRYNITICHQRKFIWFRVAKVGTRTIMNHLKESDNNTLDVEHTSGIYYPVNTYHHYFKFAFVRNPWDRLVSCWHNKVVYNNLFQFNDSEHEKMKDFGNFINYVSELNIDECDRHLRSQSVLIDLNKIDYLGRMETFDDDTKYIFRRIGLPEKEIAPMNVTSGKMPYRDYYSEQMVEKVAQIYQKDIKIFGYQF